ncbi:hypothetical protein B0J18DRAFT_431050 [Chaetomium sp. MPI-SDFR-AT-0129]|nr:hypothetical protein B0J18DRAFT_431050 [Chaetomium sp. MPI-SDFR-AT-0129]
MHMVPWPGRRLEPLAKRRFFHFVWQFVLLCSCSWNAKPTFHDALSPSAEEKKSIGRMQDLAASHKLRSRMQKFAEGGSVRRKG